MEVPRELIIHEGRNRWFWHDGRTHDDPGIVGPAGEKRRLDSMETPESPQNVDDPLCEDLLNGAGGSEVVPNPFTEDVRKKSRFAGEMGMVGPHFVSARGGGSAWCGFTRYRIGVSLLLFD